MIRDAIANLRGPVGDAPYGMIKSISEASLRLWVSGDGEPHCGGLCSWTFQEPQVERRENQDDSDVHHQPRPELVPEEQDVHADHDAYQREDVKDDGCLSAHPSFLVRAAELGQSSAF